MGFYLFCVHDKHQWFALTNNIHESGNIKRFVAGNMILQVDESEIQMQVGSTEGPGSKSEIKYFGKLPPHLLAHDVSAQPSAVILDHSQVKQRYLPAPCLSASFCARSDGFLYTAPGRMQPSCFVPDLKWPVFVFLYFCVFCSGEG